LLVLFYCDTLPKVTLNLLSVPDWLVVAVWSSCCLIYNYISACYFIGKLLEPPTEQGSIFDYCGCSCCGNVSVIDVEAFAELVVAFIATEQKLYLQL
jgi:uncharacterized membrane protein YadS